MVSTLLVIGGTLAALLVLLALIVSLSARRPAGHTSTSAPVPAWVVDQGRPHPDAWAPLSNTSTEIRAVR